VFQYVLLFPRAYLGVWADCCASLKCSAPPRIASLSSVSCLVGLKLGLRRAPF
jgi:hypothetical protein